MFRKYILSDFKRISKTSAVFKVIVNNLAVLEIVIEDTPYGVQVYLSEQCAKSLINNLVLSEQDISVVSLKGTTINFMIQNHRLHIFDYGREKGIKSKKVLKFYNDEIILDHYSDTEEIKLGSEGKLDSADNETTSKNYYLSAVVTDNIIHLTICRETIDLIIKDSVEKTIGEYLLKIGRKDVEPDIKTNTAETSEFR